MLKTKLERPVLIILLGVPGSGKTYLSRQLSELLGMVHISADRFRDTLFANPTFSKQEYEVLLSLMTTMTEQMLGLGLPVIFDISASRLADRRALRDMARKFDALPLLIWLQVDAETARFRAMNKDKRRAEDKYTAPVTQEIFEQLINIMQPPQRAEDFMVVSGKHNFDAQKSAIIRHLTEMGVLNDEVFKTYIPKPGMVNLAAQARAQAGRVDYSRRNIVIR